MAYCFLCAALVPLRESSSFQTPVPLFEDRIQKKNCARRAARAAQSRGCQNRFMSLALQRKFLGGLFVTN